MIRHINFFLLAAMVSCLSLVSVEDVKDLNLYVNETKIVNFNEYNDQVRRFRKSIEKDSSEFYHILKQVDSTGFNITTTDDYIWEIGWWYQSKVKSWEPGNRLEISYFPGELNSIKLRNVDKDVTIWGSLHAIGNPDSIAKIPPHNKDEQPASKIILKSGWVFKSSTGNAFSEWSAKQRIFAFHADSDNKLFDLWNMDKKAFVRGATLLGKERAATQPEPVEIENVTHLEAKLNKLVLAQPEATQAVTRSLVNFVAGLKDPEAPIGVFLFLGPTGVGKTELAKALAQEVYKDPSFLIRFEMSHFSEEYSLTRLIGSPPGYVNHEEGGQLTEALKAKPRSVVLLDEMEKAHSKIRKAFLPVFDEGFMTDAANNKVKVNEAIFIMTSNLCANEIIEYFSQGYSPEDILDMIEPQLIEALSPELYNRVEPVLFHPLEEKQMIQLVELMLDKVLQRIKTNKNYTVIVDDSAKKYLAKHGFHPTLGARPLKRLIDKKVVTSLSYAIVNQGIPEGSTLYLSYNMAENSWHVAWE